MIERKSMGYKDGYNCSVTAEHTVSCNIEDCKSPVFGHHRSDKAVFSGQRNGISWGSVYLHLYNTLEGKH